SITASRLASTSGSFFMTLLLKYRSWYCASIGLHESKREFIRQHSPVSRRKVARVGGMAQELAFGLEDEARLLEFGNDHGLVDPMQRLADADSGARLRGMIDDNQMSARLQRGVQSLIHLRPIDR